MSYVKTLVIRVVEGQYNEKVLLQDIILRGALLGKKCWKNLNLQTLLLTLTKVQI
jgi:hypothetical protein